MAKQTEEMIRSIALFPEENPFPVLRIGADGTLLFANRAAKELLKQWQAVIGGAVPEVIQREVAATLAEKTSRELDVPCHDRLLSFVLVPINSRGYVNLYGRDVTEQRQTEAALRESEQHYRNLFHNNHAVMLLIDGPPAFLFPAPPGQRRHQGRRGVCRPHRHARPRTALLHHP
jgi:PAS domain-containing protein